jgi:hypothetical protein
VVTSAQAAVRWLVARLPAGSPVLVLGTDGLAEEVAVGGLAPVRVADTAVAVVQGLDPATAWTDLAEASVVIRRGGLWVAGNDDSTYPSSRGPLPGNGALVAALVLATGKHPVVVGKPALDLHVASVERVGARRPLVVGDRLDTDVLGAVRAGADSLRRRGCGPATSAATCAGCSSRTRRRRCAATRPPVGPGARTGAGAWWCPTTTATTRCGRPARSPGARARSRAAR